MKLCQNDVNKFTQDMFQKAILKSFRLVSLSHLERCQYAAVADLVHTYIVLHYEVRLHAIQATIIEAGFKTN